MGEGVVFWTKQMLVHHRPLQMIWYVSVYMDIQIVRSPFSTATLKSILSNT